MFWFLSVHFSFQNWIWFFPDSVDDFCPISWSVEWHSWPKIAHRFPFLWQLPHLPRIHSQHLLLWQALCWVLMDWRGDYKNCFVALSSFVPRWLGQCLAIGWSFSLGCTAMWLTTLLMSPGAISQSSHFWVSKNLQISRTLRISIADGCYYAMAAIGNYINGPVYKRCQHCYL